MIFAQLEIKKKTYTLLMYLILREESVPDEVEDGGEKRA